MASLEPRVRPELDVLMSTISRFRLLVLFILAIGILPASVESAAAEELSVFIDRVDSREFPSLTVNLVIINEKGLPVQGITAEALVVREDGKAVSSVSLSPLVADDEPMAVTLVVDTSMSMAGKPLDDARQAAGHFVDEIGPKDEASILAFATDVVAVQDFTSDKEALKAALGSLSLGPNTALFDALAESVDATRRATAQRRVIVLLSDGEDTNSKRNLDSALKSTVAAHIPVYTVGLGNQVDRKILDQIANSTGGHSLYAPTSGDLQSTFSALATQLKSRYVLRARSNVKADNQQHSLAVSLKQQGKKSEATAQFLATQHPPRIKFVSPVEASLKGKSTPVQVTVEAVAPTLKVQFLVDGKVTYEVSREPYRFVWYLDTLSPGSHVLGATAIDSLGNSATESIDVVLDTANPSTDGYASPKLAAAPTENLPQSSSGQWRWIVPLAMGGIAVPGLVLMGKRRTKSRTSFGRKSLRLPFGLSRPRCPICGKGYLPAAGCTFCKEQEAKAISERLEQMFQGNVDKSKRL